jgi:mannose-1-phosphate guanylyltransferase/phosphomannomutase
MRIVILAGGKGTRLHPLTFSRPKPLLPLASKPSIELLASHISRLGFKEVIITLNYHKEQIMQYLGDGSHLGIKIEYCIEPEGIFLGTSGSVNMARHILTDTFMVVQGDTVTEIDLKRAAAYHKRCGADATIVLKKVPNPWLYGIAVCNSKGRITNFQEKPPKDQCLGNFISTGMYILEPNIFDFIEDTGYSDFAKDVFPRLVNAKKKVFGYKSNDFWIDIGSLKHYLQVTNRILRTIKRDIKTPTSAKIEGSVSVGRNVSIHETATVHGPVLIEDEVIIEKNSQIGPYAVLKEGTNIGENSVIKQSVLLENASLGSFCNLHATVVDEMASLNNHVKVDRSMIGRGSIIGESVQIHQNSKVWPNVSVAPNTSVNGIVSL